MTTSFVIILFLKEWGQFPQSAKSRYMVRVRVCQILSLYDNPHSYQTSNDAVVS